MRRLNRMFGAISATNEAIIRAKTELELYQLVCDAAVHSGKSFATVALLAEPGSTWLKPVAGTGEAIDLITRTRFSIDPENPYGKGVSGEAFRTQKTCINADIAARERRVDRTPRRESGVVACVALPLIKIGQERRRVDVLCRAVLGQRRGDHRAVGADRRKRFVRARQFRACRGEGEGRREEGTPDPHVRGAERNQRSDHAGQIPHRDVRTGLRGRRRRRQIYVDRNRARTGRRADISGECRRRRARLRAGTTASEVVGRRSAARRAGHRRARHSARGYPASATTILQDFGNSAHFYKVVRRQRNPVGAALPLLEGRQDDRRPGISFPREIDTFSARIRSACCSAWRKTCPLRSTISIVPTRRRRPTSKRNGLTRMFAALSATNEAIMRAKSRGELYELVCEAAAKGGKFNSASILLPRPASDRPRCGRSRRTDRGQCASAEGFDQ